MRYELATYSPSSTSIRSAANRKCYRTCSLTDKNRPDIDENKERDISKLLKREDEWEHVVWHTLCKAIQRMKGMAGIWGWHYPLVMGLVQRLVNFRMVQPPVNPVDAQVRKADK